MNKWGSVLRIVFTLLVVGIVSISSNLFAYDVIHIQEIYDSSVGQGHHFGVSIDVSGNFAAIGAVEDRAFLFSQDQGGSGMWEEVFELIPSSSSYNNQFGGSSISIENDVTCPQ